MNSFLNLLQGMGGMQLRFRDILQMLLLSAAVRIAARIYETLNRLSGTQALPMNPMYQNPLMLGYLPSAQNQLFGFPAANTNPQQPEIVPFIDPNQKGDLT